MDLSGLEGALRAFEPRGGPFYQIKYLYFALSGQIDGARGAIAARLYELQLVQACLLYLRRRKASQPD